MEISTPANYYCPAVSRSIKSDRFKRWAPSPQTEAWQNVRNTGSIFSRLGLIRSSSNGEHNWIIGDSPTNREKKGKKHELFCFLSHNVAAKKLFVGDGLTPGFLPHLGTQPGFCEANASRHTCGLLENYFVGSIYIYIYVFMHAYTHRYIHTWCRFESFWHSLSNSPKVVISLEWSSNLKKPTQSQNVNHSIQKTESFYQDSQQYLITWACELFRNGFHIWYPGQGFSFSGVPWPTAPSCYVSQWTGYNDLYGSFLVYLRHCGTWIDVTHSEVAAVWFP